MGQKLVATNVKRQQVTRLNNQDRLQEMYIFTFDVSDGTTQSVEVPVIGFSAETVKDAIDAELAELQKLVDSFD